MFHRTMRLGGRDRSRALLFILLVLCSASSLAMLAARVAYSGRYAYLSLVWDLLLAWLPLLFAVMVRRAAGRGREAWPALLTFGFFWLLFFPNAPYLLTEFVHLGASDEAWTRLLPVWLLRYSPIGGVPLWYDALMIVSFAWSGLLLGFVSLYLVQRAVRRLAGEAWGWTAAVLALTLSAFGVALGRFERWNSWDLFVRPGGLIADVIERCVSPSAHPRTTAATVLVASFLLLAYLTLFALMQTHREDDGRLA